MDLFEFKKQKFPADNDVKKDFVSFLNGVWNVYKNEKGSYWREESSEEECRKQPFFNFDEDGYFCPRGYVGYVKFENYEFNLYPKIFANSDLYDKKCFSDILWLWLSYSNFRILPACKSSLDKCEMNVIDIFIYLFAKYTTDLFSTSLYQHYETITEETSFLKGKLDFPNYVKNIACGKPHKFCCTYDSFEFNNKFNQIVKYVAKMLLNITNKEELKTLLHEIIATLDEVDDVVCREEDCETVFINRFMEDFVVILDYCKIFLSNCVSINNSGNFNAFAFLLRTDKLYEDFITNYLRENLTKEYRICPQRQIAIDEKGSVYIKPDILVYKDKELVKIIDVKYKNEKEKYVSQSDIYQILTYGYKLGCKDLTLLYPRVDANQQLDSMVIKSEFKDAPDLTLNFAFVDSSEKSKVDEDLENLKLGKSKILL